MRQPGEPVDAFMLELRRLVGLARIDSDDLLPMDRVGCWFATSGFGEAVAVARTLLSEQARDENADNDFPFAAVAG